MTVFKEAIKIVVSGITPVSEGDNWFLIDKSGEFILDTTVMAEIWLVGGGMDGTDGFTDNRGMFHGGIGGQGGNVYKFGRVKLTKEEKYAVIIANANEPNGTIFKYGQKTLSSGQLGSNCVFGGAGGIISTNGSIVSPVNGKDGISTPYGIVGSSGAGGVCGAFLNGVSKFTDTANGGIGAGNSRRYIVAGMNWENLKEFNPNIDAINYGCGGGGNTYCHELKDIGVKSKGMQGCIIVKYTALENDDGNSPECSIRFWNKNDIANDLDKTVLREEVNTLSKKLEDVKNQNLELKNQVKDLEKQLSELENS